MATLEFFLVAESVSVDQATNRLSVFNIIEEMATPGFPIFIPQLVAIHTWLRDEGDEARDFQASIELTPPGAEARRFEHNFRMPSTVVRNMTRFQGIRVEREGELRIELSLNGVHKAWHRIYVRLVQ